MFEIEDLFELTVDGAFSSFEEFQDFANQVDNATLFSIIKPGAFADLQEFEKLKKKDESDFIAPEQNLVLDTDQDSLDFSSPQKIETDSVEEYRNQVELYDKETARLIANKPNATEKELESIFQREDVPSKEVYEAIRLDDLTKEDLTAAGERKKLLNSVGYIEANEGVKSIISTEGLTDFDKERLESREKTYRLKNNETGEFEYKKESQIKPDVLDAIKTYETATDESYKKNYDDVQVDVEDFKRDDVPDAYKLESLGINKENYLKWDKVNTRQEGSVFKFFKTLLTSEEGDEFEKEQRQYEKIQSYQATELNDITNDLEKNKALQKLTSDSNKIKILKKEEKDLKKQFYDKVGTISESIDLFPKFKEMTVDKDLEKRKRLYNAVKKGEGISEGTLELLRTANTAFTGFALNFFAGIPGFFDQRLTDRGYDKKGVLAGLTDMFADTAELYDVDFGAAKRSGFLSGKPVIYRGEKYFVDKNGQVYDQNTNILMSGIIPDNTIKEIQKRSKDVPKSELMFTGGSVVTGLTNTLVNLFGLIRTGGKVNNALGLKKYMKTGTAGKVAMGLTSFTSGVVDNVDDIRSQLIATGMSEKEAMNIAVNAGQAISTLDGVFSGLAGSNEKLLTGLNGIKDQIKNLAITKGKSFTGAQFKTKSYELIKENAQELFIEEFPVLVAEKGINYLVNKSIGQNVLDSEITKEGIIETAVMTIGATSALGSVKLLTGNKRDDLVRTIAKDISDLQGTLDVLIKEKALTKKEAVNAYTEIYNMQTAENKTKGTIILSENMVPASDLLTQRQNLLNQREGLEGPGKKDVDNKIADVDAQLEALYAKDSKDANDIINSTAEEVVTGEDLFRDIEQNKQIKYLEQASKELVAEAEASGDEEFNITEEQNLARATELFIKDQDTTEKTETQVEETPKDITLNDLVNRPVTLTELGGSALETPIEGELYIEGQQVVIEDSDGNITEIGNVDEVLQKPLSEIGVKQDVSNISVDGDGNLNFNDKTLVPEKSGIKINKRGQISRVVLRSPDGSETVTLRGVNAEEAAYQILLKEAESMDNFPKSGQALIEPKKINEILEQDEEFQNEFREVEDATKTETGQDTTEVVDEKQKVEVDDEVLMTPQEIQQKRFESIQAGNEAKRKGDNAEVERQIKRTEYLNSLLDSKTKDRLEIQGDLYSKNAVNKKIKELKKFPLLGVVKEQIKLLEEVLEEYNIIEALETKKESTKDTATIRDLDNQIEEAKFFIESYKKFDKISVKAEEKVEVETEQEKYEKGLKGLSSIVLKGIENSIISSINKKKKEVRKLGEKFLPNYKGKSTEQDNDNFSVASNILFDLENKLDLVKKAIENFDKISVDPAPKAEVKVEKQVDNAKKALNKLDKDIKIVLHNDDASYRKATGEEGREQSTNGEYNPATKTIHINATNAQANTVAHEVFHALLLRNGITNKQAKAITDRMFKAVKKTASPELLEKLKKHSDKYESALESEESIAELFGLLASEYPKMDAPTQNLVHRWINKLANILGVKKFTDAEVIDLLNVVSAKVEAGQEITEQDVAILDGSVSGVINGKARKQASVLTSFTLKRFPTNPNINLSEDTPLSNFNQKKSNLLESDRMTGAFIADAKNNPVFKFFGGIYFPQITGKWWASRTLSKATSIAENMNANRDKDGYIYATPIIMKPNSHMSNQDMFETVWEFMKFDLRSKSSKVTKKLFSEYLTKALTLKSVNLTESDLNIKKSDNIETMITKLNKVLLGDDTTLSFEKRKAIIKAILGDPKVTEDRKFPTAGSISEVASKFEEEKTKQATKLWDVVMLMRTKGTLSTKITPKSDEFYHKSYPAEISSDQEIEVFFLDGAYNIDTTYPELNQSSGKVFSWKEYSEKHPSAAMALSQYGRTAKLSKASGNIVAPQSRKQKPNYKLAKINTPNTTINVVEGAGPDSFEIATKDYKATEGVEGSTIIGFVKNKDFPGEKKKETRGEIFILQVGDKGKGTGTSLMLDALRLMKENGTKTVKFTVPSKEGKPFNESLVRKGYINLLKVSDRTGTSEYEITDKVLEDAPQSRKQRTTRLAPNGKQSNLTDVQYDAVRTPVFKKWFGDWNYDSTITGYDKTPDNLMGISSDSNKQKGFDEQSYKYNLDVEISADNGKTWEKESIKGLNRPHAIENAKRNWGKKGSGILVRDANSSKIVDENGEPMVVYHGSAADFNVFDKKKLGSLTNTEIAKAGFFFASNKKAADQYAFIGGLQNPYLENKLTEARAFFLNIKNPYKGTNKEWNDLLNWASDGSRKYDSPTALKKANKEFKESLLEDNFDGVDFDNGLEIVAFEPTQAKLADGSNTEFDPNNPSIRKQISEKVKQENEMGKLLNPTRVFVAGIDISDIIFARSYGKSRIINEKIKSLKSDIALAKRLSNTDKIETTRLRDALVKTVDISVSVFKKEAKRLQSKLIKKDGSLNNRASEKIKNLDSKIELLEDVKNTISENLFSPSDLKITDTPESRKQKPSNKPIRKRTSSIKKAITEIKNVLKITPDEQRTIFKALNDQKKEAKEIKKDIVASLRDLVKKGKITPNKMVSVINKVPDDFNNPITVERFVEYMTKVFNDADYGNKMMIANAKKGKARKNVSTKLGIAEGLVDQLQRLFSVKPSLIPDSVLDQYMELINIFGKRESVLSLPPMEQVIQLTEDILQQLDEEQSMAMELVDIYENADKVYDKKTGDLDYAATIKQMLDDEVINESQYEVMKKYKSEIKPTEPATPKTEAEIEAKRQEVIKDVKATKEVDPSVFPSRLERDLAKRFKKLLKTDAINDLSLDDLKNLFKVIDNINNGYLPHYAQIMVGKINAINDAKVGANAIKRSKLLPLSKIYANLKSKFGKTGKTPTSELQRRNPTFYIDQIFGDFKTKDIFNSIFNRSAEASAKYTKSIKEVQAKIEKVEQAVFKSFGREPNKVIMSKYKQMSYLIQQEFLSNPDSKQVNSVEDFLKVTIKRIKTETTSYTETDAKMLQEILDTYTEKGTKPFDIDQLYKSFNVAEKNSIRTLEEINKSMTERAVYTANIIRGTKITPLKNYTHLSVIPEVSKADIIETETSQISDMFNKYLKPSTKAKSLIERTGKVSPLNFDVYASVQRGAKYTLMDFNLTEPIRTARRTINQIEKNLSDKDGNMPVNTRRIFNAIRDASVESIEMLLSNALTQNTIADKAVDFIQKQGYRAILAGPFRSTYELLSNAVGAVFFDPLAITTGIKNRKLLASPEGKEVMNNLNSTETNRVFSTGLSGKFVDTGILNQAAGITASRAKGKVENTILKFWNKTGQRWIKGVEFTADTLISSPDKLVMQPMWFGAFENRFKQLTGKSPDFDKIASNDETYMDKYATELNDAKTLADTKSVYLGATDNAFMGILKGTVKPNQSSLLRGFNAFNGFMTRFLIFEYITARTGIMAAVGNGQVNKRQGAALLAGVATRMITYTFMGTLVSEVIKDLTEDEDDEDFDFSNFQFEDDDEQGMKSIEKILGQAMVSTFTSLALGRDFGNSTKSIINLGIEDLNERYGQFLRDGKYDQYRDAIQYTIIPKEKNGKIPLVGDVVPNLFAAFSPMIKTTVFGINKIFESDKVQPDAIERQQDERFIRLPLEILGILGFIPMYKDVRKIVLSDMYKGLRKAKKDSANKKKRKEEMLQGYNSESDMKRYDFPLWEITFGPDSPGYDKRQVEKELKRKERKLREQEKDQMYNYIPPAKKRKSSSSPFGSSSNKGKSSSPFGSSSNKGKSSSPFG